MQGIVTGASRGLGLALTRALVARGWRLVVDAREAEPLERAVAGLDGVVWLAGDVADPDHRARSSRRPASRSTCWSTTRARWALLRCSRWRSTRSRNCATSTRSTCSRRWHSPSSCCLAWPTGGRILNLSSDAAVEAYEQWGGYGSSKAALSHLTAILGVENPDLRVYAVDPGDMRTQMLQDALPGEDISDRPPPEESVPGLLTLIEGDVPSGTYRAHDLAEVSA